jgi:hypothetical protein
MMFLGAFLFILFFVMIAPQSQAYVLGLANGAGTWIAAWAPFIVRSVQLYFVTNYPQAASFIPVDVQMFRSFLEQQGVFVFFVTIYAGAGLVAPFRATLPDLGLDAYWVEPQDGNFMQFNTGGGVKVSLAGPLRLRVDYRVFKLGSGALYSPAHRIYAGLNLKL